MRKTFNGFKIATIVIMAVELAFIVIFSLFYIENIFNLTNTITTLAVLIILSSILIFDTLWVTFLLIFFEAMKKKTDLKVAELIGQDIAEAYNFGMIGLVIVDDQNSVIWVNDLFKERQIEILEKNIVEWQPALRELIDGGVNTTTKILLNARNYEVKFLKDAGLYIFKDITELTKVSDYSDRQAVVVGQVVIDNYNEILSNGEEADDIVNVIRTIIMDYCKEYGVLVRKMRGDAYFLLCNHETLQKMEADKFSLLDKVRKTGEKEIVPPTISLGIAYGFPDVMKLNEMAGNAIEIAMSRGGDQAIVSQYGQELVFFGGKTDAQETKNKVKVRVMGDSIISLIKASSNVIIMGHDNTDMDAIGACLGMKSICDYCEKEALIIYDPKRTERKTRGAISATFGRDSSSFLVSESKALSEIKANTLVIVCDVHRADMTLSPKVIEKANKIMILDHHRRGESMIDSPIFAVIDPSASSSSELVAELIYYSTVNPKIIIEPAYATIMLSGIFLDSNYFKNSSSGASTFEASMILKDFGANNAIADDFLKDEFEEYTLINKIVSTLKTPFYGVVYCVADDEDTIDGATLSKVANQCMQMKGVNACFVIGRTSNDEIKISCRSDGSVNVQIIAEKLSGGGHFTQAACVFKNITISQAEAKLLSALSYYLNDARVNKGA